MSSPSSSKLYPYLALGLGALLLGISALLVRLAAAPGTVTAFYRMGIGALLMTYPFVRYMRTPPARLPRRGVLLAVLAGLSFGCDLALWSTGVTMSNATNPTLMANTAPLWVGLGAWLIFRERQTSQFWAGLAIALVGSAVVMGEDLSRAAEFGLGTFFGLLAGMFYGAYYLISQKGRALLNTLAYFYLTTASSSIILFIFNLLLGRSFFGYPTQTYLIFLAAGLLVQIGGWLAINYAQGHLPASVVAPTLLGQPVFTAIFATLLLGEILTRWHIVGGITVLAGVYIVHRSRLSH